MLTNETQLFLWIGSEFGIINGRYILALVRHSRFCEPFDDLTKSEWWIEIISIIIVYQVNVELKLTGYLECKTQTNCIQRKIKHIALKQILLNQGFRNIPDRKL